MKLEKTHKTAGIYAIFIGISIIALWLMLLITDQIPEIETAFLSLLFHIIAESSMAVLLIISGIKLIRKTKFSVVLFNLAIGTLIYSVINSSGYYAQNGNWTFVSLFMVLLAFSIFVVVKINLLNIAK